MNTSETAYEPIACAFHERLEFAVLRRQRLRLRYLSGSDMEEAEAVVLPVDVRTRDGAEWLHFRIDAGEVRIVRLDRLISAEPELL